MRQDPYGAILRIAQIMQEIEDKRGELMAVINEATDIMSQLKHVLPPDDFVKVLGIRGAMIRDNYRLSDLEMFERHYDVDHLLSAYRPKPDSEAHTP